MEIKIFISIIILIMILYLLHCYSNANKLFEGQRKEFVNYLNELNDIESLKAIGEINPFGVFERWNISVKKIEGYFSSKEEFLNNEKVLQFLNDIYDFEKAYKQYLIPAFILLFILINILISLRK